MLQETLVKLKYRGTYYSQNRCEGSASHYKTHLTPQVEYAQSHRAIGD